MRLLHTHPLTCNPQRLPHKLAGVYSDAIQAPGNAKGTLCKGEITTAKSLLSFSLPLCPPPPPIPHTHTDTHAFTHNGGKISLAWRRKPWKREADAL